MVAELKLQTVDKGRAVAELAGLPLFAGRRPVYIGDDVTDEAAFKVVNDMGGISVRVGDSGNSAAQYELADVQAMHHWLAGTKD